MGGGRAVVSLVGRYLLSSNPCAPTVSVPVPVPTHPAPLSRRQHISSTGQLRHTLYHSGNVFSVAISPCGDYIVSGSYDRLVRIWDSASGAYAYTSALVVGLPDANFLVGNGEGAGE